MKVIIIGAGRMGIRHVLGILNIPQVDEVTLVDTNQESLGNARQQLSDKENYSKIVFLLLDQFKPAMTDAVIISTTAASRIETCKLALACSPGSVLIEKPLGQSFEEVKNLASFFSSSDAYVSVNLNMRLYSVFQTLKTDMSTWPQFVGPKTIIFNGGALGIGANGIHYLDLMYFLFDADRAELAAGEIDTYLIPSGRGKNFGDFGGWAVIKFYKEGDYLGKAILNLSAHSTAFGGWDIIGTHARVRINELEETRVNIVRNPKSILPMNRYAAEYLPPEHIGITSPFLGDLTKSWLEGEISGNHILPEINQTLKVHQLMFDWLELSDEYSRNFPIT